MCRPTSRARAPRPNTDGAKGIKKPCVIYQDDEFGKNVLDGFNQQLAAIKLHRRLDHQLQARRSDFSSQVAKMKSDGCDFVVLGTIVRETVGAMAEAKKLGFASPSSAARRPTWSRCRRSARK